MEGVLIALALLFYLVGILLSFIGTARRRPGLHPISTAMLGAAWIVHLAALVWRGWDTGQLPLSNNAEFLLCLGWVVLTFYLVIWIGWRVHAAGLVLPPLAALAAVISLGLLPGAHETSPYSATHGWFVIHTIAATLGLAALGVAFAMSLIFILQHRALKAKRSIRLLERLPSLRTCDRIGYGAILSGFPLLTLGIVTGFVRNLTAHHQVWIPSAKQVFPLAAWLMFGLLLYARLVRGYHGPRSAYVTIAGFIIGLMTILGIAR